VARVSGADRRFKKKIRIAKKVRGTAEKPRLCVFRSNKHIYAQLIDDEAGKSIVSASSLQMGLDGKGAEAAAKVGEALAQKAVGDGVKEVVFDRSGYRYHGRVKALAESARSTGLKF